MGTISFFPLLYPSPSSWACLQWLGCELVVLQQLVIDGSTVVSGAELSYQWQVLVAVTWPYSGRWAARSLLVACACVCSYKSPPATLKLPYNSTTMSDIEDQDQTAQGNDYYSRYQDFTFYPFLPIYLSFAQLATFQRHCGYYGNILSSCCREGNDWPVWSAGG